MRVLVYTGGFRDEFRSGWVDVIQKAKIHYYPLLQVLIKIAQERRDMEVVNIINNFLISGRLG